MSFGHGSSLQCAWDRRPNRYRRTVSDEPVPPPPNPRPGVSQATLGRSYGLGGYGAPPIGGSAFTGSAYGGPASPGPTSGLRPADLRRRAAAAGIDAGAIVGPTLIAGLLGYFAIYRPACRSYAFLDGTRLDCSDAGAAGVWAWLLVAVTFLVVVVLYEVLPVGRHGATWGMSRIGVSVVDDREAQPIGWRRSALRSLLRWTVSVQLAGMGYWWAAVDDRGLTWHDLIGRTVVVEAPAADLL